MIISMQVMFKYLLLIENIFSHKFVLFFLNDFLTFRKYLGTTSNNSKSFLANDLGTK